MAYGVASCAFGKDLSGRVADVEVDGDRSAGGAEGLRAAGTGVRDSGGATLCLYLEGTKLQLAVSGVMCVCMCVCPCMCVRV